MPTNARADHDPPAPEPVEVLLGLGSNLGDRDAAIAAALDALGRVPGVEVVEVSPLLESEPVGGPPQSKYRNGAARLRTTLVPHALLAVLKATERAAGRVPGPRNGPRPLDLDILTFGGRTLDTRDLVVPHPRLHERSFVVEPLRALGVDVDAIPRIARPRVVDTPAAVQEASLAWRRGGCSIGFVPTMGALHEGHASLIRRARAECDRVVVSIFVNPLQFAAHEDLDKYPRPLSADLELCERNGVDLAFVPPVEAMYPAGFASRIAVGAEAEAMEGAARPGHFIGVATVVARLWSIVLPDRSYYGRKDAQQVAVLRRLQQDLCLSGELVECPIDREADGGDGAWFVGGNVPVHMGNDPLGQVVPFDFIVQSQFLELGNQSPVTADDPLHQALVPQMIQPPFLAVALTGGIDQGEVPGTRVLQKI